MWFTNWGNNTIGRISTSGVITDYDDQTISSPRGITAGPDGALWFTNTGNNSIGRITTAGVVSNFIGPGIDDPGTIAAGPDGALWFTNTGNNSIGRITTGGVVTTYAGTGIDLPDGISAGSDGAMWFTNELNGTLGRITMTGVVTSYSGTGSLAEGPVPITTGPDGALWFAEFDNDLIGRLLPTGEAPSISGACLSQASVGVSYSCTVDLGGVPAPTVSAGGLPSGLTVALNGNGTASVSGTPDAGSGGSYVVAITASNGVAPDTTLTFPMTVDQALAFTSDIPALTTTAGQKYSYGFSASGFPAPTYNLGAGAPAWLAIDAATGALSGTVLIGTSSFDYSVIASNEESGSASVGPYTVIVAPANQPPGGGGLAGPVVPSPLTQAISFTAPSKGTTGSSAALSATGGGSGNPVVFSVETTSGAGVCSLSGTNGTTVNYSGPGSCVIDANQAGNAAYLAAPQAQRTIVVLVGAAGQTISFAPLGRRTLLQSTLTVLATASSGLPVVFTATGAAICSATGKNGATITL